MITRARYQDPVMPKLTTEQWHDDIEYLGGFACIQIRVTFHRDEHSIEIDDIELIHFELGFEDIVFRWDYRHVDKISLHRIGEIVDLVGEPLIRERILDIS